MKRLVLHFTILLLVFGAAAYKAEHTALLACSLLGEASTIFFLLSKMQASNLEIKNYDLHMLACTFL